MEKTPWIEIYLNHFLPKEIICMEWNNDNVRKFPKVYSKF